MSRTKRVALCALFTALLVVSGFVRIPTPVIAITLQVQVTLLAGVLLGGEWGALSALVYTVLGLIGLPVFAYGGGISYALQPTFGYLLGLSIGAFVAGKIAKRGEASYARLFLSAAAGLGVVYLLGTAYALCILLFYLGETPLWKEFLVGYIVIPLCKDILLTAVCLPPVKRLLPRLNAAVNEKRE